jgi:serine/threonine protein kinase|tara:strand:- start:900 stop:1679 length:780 start_codon:yes stop_codon:yes gene_type:complete
MLLQGKYCLKSLLGKGAYSQVYAGVHKEKGTKVAIKFDISNNEVSTKLIEHEIRMYMYFKKIKIDNVANIKSFGTFENHHYLIMDYLPFTLEEWIKKTKDKRQVENICEQMYSIVSKLHSHDVVHRDIKPDNFMVSTKGQVYLIDLGLSSVLNHKKILKNPIGTSLYCSFQCHKDSYTYATQDDILSLFYVIFSLLSEKPLPWESICVESEKVKNDIFYLLKKETNFGVYYNTPSNTVLDTWLKNYTKYVNAQTVSVSL